MAVHRQRVQRLNDKDPAQGTYVLYWMQQSQRAQHNDALEYAVERADALDQSCLVVFGLMDDYPEANLRHYHFMLEGLRETSRELADRGIKLVVRRGSPESVALELGRRASVVVCDRGYLRHQKKWRQAVASEAPCAVFQVESDAVVPVDVVSDKAEYAARTIRRKLAASLDEYVQPLRATAPSKSSLPLAVKGLDLDDVAALCRKLKLDRSVPPADRWFRGGTEHAKRAFRRFRDRHLADYAESRRRPHQQQVSHLSMYLHFGQISPVWIAREMRKHIRRKNSEAFLEELITRRELALNFAHHTRDYDAFTCIPDWARQTLGDHQPDDRDHVYTRKQLEEARTHDEVWNAAMREMKLTGYLHNHLRMYWGKQILAWTNTPAFAYRTALELNNRYFLDGRDASSYANVAWLFGLHDRAFQENPVFGKVRIMTRSGIDRKVDVAAYLGWVDSLHEDA